MEEPADASAEWLQIPDEVAVLLGRVAFYAAWVDDVLGEAVVLATPHATHLGESTPNWAASGARLVAAVRGITVYPPVTEQLADRLAALNETRNHLVHGVWMWRDSDVMVMKRSLKPGERHVEYATFSYAEIEELVRHYQTLGNFADRFVAILMKNLERPYEGRYRCPKDGTPLEGSISEEIIVQLCPACGHTVSANPSV